MTPTSDPDGRPPPTGSPGRAGRARSDRRRAPAPPPVPVLIVAALAVVFVALPLAGLLWRVPWRDAPGIAARREVRQALWLSLQTSCAAAVVAAVIGVPLAWVLARHRFPGRSWIRALCVLPMLLPPVVSGVALFAAFGRRGLVGRWLDEWFGLRLPFTTTGVVVAQAFVALPFLVLSVEAGLGAVDVDVEGAARTLGAKRWFVFRHVTLPSIAPSLAAGVVLAWARALGEFGATVTFAGSFPGETETMPLATFRALETDPDAAIVIALILVAVSLTVLVGLRDRWLGGARESLR